MPHDSSLTYSLLQVAALGDGNLTTIVTDSCTLDTNRTQYFVISCSNTGVANKLASIQIKAVLKPLGEKSPRVNLLPISIYIKWI